MELNQALRAKGFSLIELMFSLAIVGAVMTVGAPSLGRFINDMRVSTKTNDFLAFLQYTRSEAARRGARVTICISSDQATCSVSGTDWAVGALAFIDADASGQVNTGDTVLRVFDGMPSGFTVTATSAFATGYYFYYRPSGAASSAGTLRLCRSGSTARDVSVSSVGRPMSTLTTTTCT